MLCGTHDREALRLIRGDQPRLAPRDRGQRLGLPTSVRGLSAPRSLLRGQVAVSEGHLTVEVQEALMVRRAKHPVIPVSQCRKPEHGGLPPLRDHPAPRLGGALGLLDQISPPGPGVPLLVDLLQQVHQARLQGRRWETLHLILCEPCLRRHGDVGIGGQVHTEVRDRGNLLPMRADPGHDDVVLVRRGGRAHHLPKEGLERRIPAHGHRHRGIRGRESVP